MDRLREYLYVIWAAGVFCLLPLQLMIVTLFKEHLEDLLIELISLEGDRKGNGQSWPHIRQQYIRIPQNEGNDEKFV